MPAGEKPEPGGDGPWRRQAAERTHLHKPLCLDRFQGLVQLVHHLFTGHARVHQAHGVNERVLMAVNINRVSLQLLGLRQGAATRRRTRRGVAAEEVAECRLSGARDTEHKHVTRHADGGGGGDRAKG